MELLNNLQQITYFNEIKILGKKKNNLCAISSNAFQIQWLCLCWQLGKDIHYLKFKDCEFVWFGYIDHKVFLLFCDRTTASNCFGSDQHSFKSMVIVRYNYLIAWQSFWA